MSGNRRKKNTDLKIAIWSTVLLVGALLLSVMALIGIGSIMDGFSDSTVEKEGPGDIKKFSGVKNETNTETIKYTSSTVSDSNLDEGEIEIITKGVNGTKTITYEVTYEDGVEISRKKVSEEVTEQPVNEVKAIGTRHIYTGFCSVEGTYRRRYAYCVGDYSPQARVNAEAKAYECNANNYAVQGCYNTYR